jgi:hypothetical protein
MRGYNRILDVNGVSQMKSTSYLESAGEMRG